MKIGKTGLLIGGVVVGLALGTTAVLVGGKVLGERQPTEKRMRVEARRVVNGHYVKVDDHDKLVYAGIRAPYENEPFHGEAKQRNAELAEGKELRLRFERDVFRDDDGRLFAYAFVNDLFVNEVLVLEGMAYVRLTPDTNRFADVLLAAQAAARRGRVGLWKLVTASDEPSYPADPKYGDFHRPSCEVVPRINAERRIELASKAEAFDNGFAPCNKCRP